MATNGPSVLLHQLQASLPRDSGVGRETGSDVCPDRVISEAQITPARGEHYSESEERQRMTAVGWSAVPIPR